MALAPTPNPLTAVTLVLEPIEENPPELVYSVAFSETPAAASGTGLNPPTTAGTTPHPPAICGGPNMS